MYRVCGYGGLVNDVKVDKGMVGGALSMVILVDMGRRVRWVCISLVMRWIWVMWWMWYDVDVVNRATC